jgi:transposase-like protein
LATHPRRRGQRYYSDATRARALKLAREGVSPKDIAARLGVARGTVRSWLSRGQRPIVRQVATDAELHAMADRADAILDDLRQGREHGDAHATLRMARQLGNVLDWLMLHDGGPVPDAVAARLTVDPWSGEPIRRAEVSDRPWGPTAHARDAARRRRGY